MTAAILQGLSRNSGIDSVGSITPIDSITALRAVTIADTPGSEGLDHPKIVAVDGWATKGDSWQGFLECMGDHSATSASFTCQAQIQTIGGGYVNQIDVTGITGTISVGDALSGTGVLAGTYILAQISGPTGGNGSYYTNYVVNAHGTTLTTSSDNGATQFVDASSRLWKRLWDGYHFPAEWCGMFVSNTDNGQLMGLVPKFTECRPLIPFSQDATSGASEFVTYPTQAQISNVQWKGFPSVWSCTGSLGASFPSPASPVKSVIAFDYTYSPPRSVQFTGNGFVPVYDITGTGLSGFEGISIVNQLGITFGIGLRLGGALNDGQFVGFIDGPTSTVHVTSISIGSMYVNAQVFGPNVTSGCYITGQISGTPGGIGVYSYVTGGAPYTISSQEMTIQSPIELSEYVNNLFTRPKDFAVGGFALNIIFGAPANHTFLTGGENFIAKGGQVGLWFDQNAAGTGDTGENMMFMNFDFAALAGAVQMFNCVKCTFDGGSFDYCTRNAYLSNNYTVFKNVYHETSTSGAFQFPTTAELYAQDIQSRTTFDSNTSFLGLPYPAGPLIAFDGGSAGSSFANFNNCQFFDVGSIPIYTPGTLRQFINPTAADNIYGQVTGFNGFNMIPALSPGNLINADYNFASGGLTLYPGSTNVTNQTGVIPPGATNAALLSGSASLNFAKISVNAGQVIYMTLLDKLIGQLSGVGGAMNFYTEDDILIQTVPINTQSQVPNFAGFYGGDTLAPNFNTTARDWTLQWFAFRPPGGTSYMTGNIGTALGTVTWNPNDKASNTTLSNGNLTATGGAGASGGARANANITSASIYCEFTATSGAGAIAFGNLNAPSYGGIGGNSDAFIFTPSGTLILNFATTTGLPTWTVGDNIGVSFKLVSGTCLFWYCVNGGDWLGNPSADPATSTGGVNVSALNGHGTTPYYPMLQLQTGDAVTANFGATSYAHAAPAGYSSITAASSYYVGNLAMYGNNTNG